MRTFMRAAGVAAFATMVPFGAVALATAPAVATGAGRPAVPHAVGVFHDVQKSSNWSGYAVSGTTKFTEVVGTWKQPASKCSSGTQYASFWVGIDGYSSKTVEQLGTDSDCSGGSPRYYGWYEMYPAGSVNIGSKYPVKPGDTLTAEVKVSGSTFTLSIKSSAGWTFSINKTGSSTLKQSSAEWVIESPSICGLTGCTVAKLADYGTVSFSASEAAAGGALRPISAFTASSGPHELIMTNSKHTIVRSQPTGLGSTGETFTATWKHA